MASINDFTFITSDTENFFNEFEEDILNYITTNGNGVYKLTQNKQGLFTAVDKVTEVAETEVTNKDGRVQYIGEGDADDYVYVQFAI
jgi:hypothetical protein